MLKLFARKKLSRLAIIIANLVIISGCESVKPYQRMYLNDPTMSFEKTNGMQFESYFESIREGGLVPNSTKSSGGCGCN